MKQSRRLLVSIAAIGLSAIYSGGVPSERPQIWVTQDDRACILRKIEMNGWAQADLAAMRARVADAVAAHGMDPEEFLRRLRLEENAAEPDRHPVLARIEGNMASIPPGQRRRDLHEYMCVAVDCGILYFLTEETAYARCAADILHLYVEALVQMEPYGDTFNGGLLYSDHLYDARVVGAQLPLVYDFVARYLAGGGTVYDISRRTQVAFNFTHAQQVFRTYARLALERGLIDCNWPVLEMASLAHNALALEDTEERRRLLDHVIRIDTDHQDSLEKVMARFAASGSVWPESINYANAVAELTTYIVALLLRQQSGIDLPDNYELIPLALARVQDFRFPNGQYIRFGDGPRHSSENFAAYEMAWMSGRMSGDLAVMERFGEMIASGLRDGRYLRKANSSYHLSPHPYLEPLRLLWFGDADPRGEATQASGRVAALTVDALPFAGLVLQRNLAPDGDPDNGLMAAVIGGHYVHAHASGMSLELYAAGEVLGSPAGKGLYRSDEHENHRRLFAAYNSVIVNGSSCGSGGWVNLGIDTVTLVSSEPAVGGRPASPNHSFTLTRFEDRQLDGGTALQERLVGIVRTSATTGYYVDVFRSRATSGQQYHDYLYHNIGDSLALSTRSGPLQLKDTPERFVPAAGTRWVQNDQYLYPGWHFFRDAQSSGPVAGTVTAGFSASAPGREPVGMRVFLPGTEGREYARALAPATREAPSPYDQLPTPVLVVRQYGEAWERPFAAVYEPVGGGGAGAVRSVEALRDSAGKFAGFTVSSEADGRALTQYVLVGESADSEFEDGSLGLYLRGRYAVVAVDAAGACVEAYLGEGTHLRFKDLELKQPGRFSSAD